MEDDPKLTQLTFEEKMLQRAAALMEKMYRDHRIINDSDGRPMLGPPTAPESWRQDYRRWLSDWERRDERHAEPRQLCLNTSTTAEGNPCQLPRGHREGPTPTRCQSLPALQLHLPPFVFPGTERAVPRLDGGWVARILREAPRMTFRRSSIFTPECYATLDTQYSAAPINTLHCNHHHAGWHVAGHGDLVVGVWPGDLQEEPEPTD